MTMLRCKCGRRVSSNVDQCPYCYRQVSIGGSLFRSTFRFFFRVILGMCAGVALLFAGAIALGVISQSDDLLDLQPVVTQAEYLQIKHGMSYQEVVEIIGVEGTETASHHLDGEGLIGDLDTIDYTWQNPSGSNMSAMFQNDRMTLKAQFGLY